MGAVIPVVVFAVLWVAILALEPRASWRRAFLGAATGWGITVAAITEALSLLRALTFTGALVAWPAVLVALLLITGILARRRGKAVASFSDRLAAKLGSSYETLRATPAPLLAAVAGMGVIVVVVGVIGVASAPNNWDSMTFHLARVMYWIEHGSLAPYPTDIMRQIYEAPWAEFAVAQFYLLSGGDQFSALVQWWSMLGSLIGVSLIARQLGASRAGQLFAVVFAATIPMGILQGSSTQNDFVVTFWFVCFVSFLLAMRERPDDVWNSLGSGASLGLAMLTKATTYVYALPFLALLVFWAIRGMRWRAWQSVMTVASVAITLNLGYYLRNYIAFGAIFGPGDEVSQYANARFTPKTLLSNSIRDLALQMGTPFPRVNAAIDQAIRAVFDLLKININDPGTTWSPYAFNALSLHEDYTGNPAHFLVILAVVALCLALARLRADRLLLTYVASIIASFLIFALYLRWQPWHSRLELVFFILFAPACGLALSRVSPRIALNLLAVALVVASTPWVIANRSRPLVGASSVLATSRTDQYFANRSVLEPVYTGGANYLFQRGCSTIGLIDNIDDWEYPWWALVYPASGSVQIEHIAVENDTARLANAPAYAGYDPCAIIVYRPHPPASITYQGMSYILGWRSSPITIYIKQ